MQGRFAGLRMLLLFLVVFGVAGMHTLGHVSGHHCPPGTHTADTPADAPAAAGGHGVDMVLLGAGMVTPSGGCLDPTAVCLAILTSLGLAALLALVLLSGWRSGRHTPSDAGALALPGRGPPPFRWFGLLVADLSVLRR